MRFRIQVEACVLAESTEKLDGLVDQIARAAAAAAGASCIHHPAERWVSSVSVDGLDDESETALIGDGRWLSQPLDGQGEDSQGACRIADDTAGRRLPAEPSP